MKLKYFDRFCLQCKRFLWYLPILPLFIFFCLVMVIFLPYSCLKLQHSKCFYEGDSSYASFLSRNKAESRLALARHYFELAFNESRKPYTYGWNVMKGQSSAPPSLSKPKLTVLLMGVNRNRRHIDAYKPHYLSQSLYSLSDSLDKDVLKNGKRWDNVHIMFCNIDKQPANFTEAIFYSLFFPVIELPPDIHKSACPHEQQLSHCLSQAVTTIQSDHLVFAEDDMLARRDFWDGIWKFSTERLTREKSKKIAYIQLHTRMHDYHYSLGDASTLLEFLLIAGGSTFALFTVCFRAQLKPYNILYNICICGFVFFTFSAIVWVISRPHILSAYHSLTRHYRLGEPTHSGFSASLMPAMWVRDMAAHLKSVTVCKDHDSKVKAIDNFVASKALKVLASYPSLMQHVGLYSDYSKNTINPYHLDD